MEYIRSTTDPDTYYFVDELFAEERYVRACAQNASQFNSSNRKEPEPVQAEVLTQFVTPPKKPATSGRAKVLEPPEPPLPAAKPIEDHIEASQGSEVSYSQGSGVGAAAPFQSADGAGVADPEGLAA
eukprot:13236880-Alexandrium_andersonii.AAC.1